MKTGLVGLPLAGKTTIFKMLTRARVETNKHRGRKAEPNIGVVQVPDDRLGFLASIFNPKKTTHATIEFIDVQGLTRSNHHGLALEPVRDVDAMVHVVRAFEDAVVPHSKGSVDPERDIRDFDAELILSDLASVEKRLERLEKELKNIKDDRLVRERNLMGRALEWLETERPLREMEFDQTDRKLMSGFAFLSDKPIIYAINLGDDSVEMIQEAPQAGSTKNSERVYLCGKLEAEMAELPEEELSVFLADYGLEESGLERLIRSTYHLLGLISFLTAGEEECRAWTIRRGTKAQQAAGTIHTDLEKHFIRAEVAHFKDFLEHRSFAKLRDHGLLRLEGKEYEVRDGDIMTVRHSG